MGRRDEDPRPPIEIVGAEPEIASLQRVSRGGRPSRRSSVRALAVSSGVVGLLLLGLALDGDDPAPPDERSAPDTTTSTQPGSTTTRGSTTTTTTTVPVGPVFGEPVGGALLAFGGGSWVVVDLDTGARREVDLFGLGEAADPWASVALSDGVVVLDAERKVRYISPLAGGGPLDSVLLGTADQVLSAGSPDRVWLIDAGGSFEGVPEASRAQVRLVDLGGQVLRSFELPTPFADAGLPEGLVLQQGGQVYLAGPGGIGSIGRGTLVSWGGNGVADVVVMVMCDAGAECSVVQVDGAGSVRTLMPLEDPFTWGIDVFGSEDGRLAVATHGPTGSGEVALFAADGRPLGSIPADVTSGDPLRWLPGDRGLLTWGGSVRWIHQIDGRWVSETPPALEGLSPEALWVIRP